MAASFVGAKNKFPGVIFVVEKGATDP